MYLWIIHKDRLVDSEKALMALPKTNKVVEGKGFKYVVDAEDYIRDNYEGVFKFDWDEIEPIKHSFVYKRARDKWLPTNLWIELIEIEE